jgi:hypothetical protein
MSKKPTARRGIRTKQKSETVNVGEQQSTFLLCKSDRGVGAAKTTDDSPPAAG